MPTSRGLFIRGRKRNCKARSDPWNQGRWCAWLKHIHYMWDEYGRCRWNLRRGVPLPEVGTFENPFHAGMGSPIRSEIWACLCPNQPELAARFAALDASLDHGAEGIAGEVFFAALGNLVLSGSHVRAGLNRAMTFIDSKTETARALALTLELHARGAETWSCREQLLEAHGHENFTHAPLNVALTVWALLYGGGDFEQSILLAVNGGYDTDCTAATVGATLGLALGAEGIPARWRKPIGEDVFTGIGILDIAAPRTLTALTERTVRLADRLAATPEPSLSLPKPTGRVDLRQLPGAITIDGAPWANGELPASVKRAGGGSWTWESGAGIGQPHFLIALLLGRLYRYPLADYRAAATHLEAAFDLGLASLPQRTSTCWTVATLAERELHDRDLAVRYYARFLKEFPNHRTAFMAKQGLKRLKAPLPEGTAAR